ncbi:MAG TPA: hypothetical protein VEJ47_20410 [Candidatus Eremiobacteraceae bacterium]|nr:hypothetical protein [Candidatus Eremiobacteraceae bacterium]
MLIDESAPLLAMTGGEDVSEGDPEGDPDGDPAVAGADPPVGGAFSGAFSLGGMLAGAWLAEANAGGTMAIRSAGSAEPVAAAPVPAMPPAAASPIFGRGVSRTAGVAGAIDSDRKLVVDRGAEQKHRPNPSQPTHSPHAPRIAWQSAEFSPPRHTQ